MQLAQVLPVRAIRIETRPMTRDEVIGLLVRTMCDTYGIAATHIDSMVQVVLAREKTSGTGIGSGVAIPHARHQATTTHMAAMAVLERPVDFSSLDGQPASIVILLVGPPDSGRAHLEGLSRVARIFNNQGVRNSVLKAKSPAEIHRIIEDAEQV